VLSLLIDRVAIAAPVGELGVVGVDADDGVDEFCQRGHWPGVFPQARVNGRHHSSGTRSD
jgi:hypothetical protein